MRVGYLTSQYPAASHTFIQREIEELRRRGVDIRTFSVRRPAENERNVPRSRAAFESTTYVLPIDWPALVAAHVTGLLGRPGAYFRTLRRALRHRAPGAKMLLWALFHFAEAILLAQMLRREGVERVHNHFANSAATVGLLATEFLGLPWSITLHGISEFDYPAGLLLADKLERVEFAACVSYFGMAQAMRLTRPAIWPKLRLVRCAIDPADLPEPQLRQQESGTVQVICVGRLSPEKGHAGLIAAFANLVAKGLPLHLTLVGDGPEGEALQALVGELGIEGAVSFAGRLDEAATLKAIAGADILVLASFMEGLPVVLMEAMALGVPVIASRVAGIPELVREEETGLLFEPGHWAQLEQVIERLSLDAELRRRLAARARERVTEEFTYPGAAAPLTTMLESKSPNR